MADHLIRAGYQVRMFDRLIYDNQTVVPIFYNQPGFEFCYGDIANSDQMIAALDGITDIVFLAGLVGDPITRKFPEQSEWINDRAYDQTFDLLSDRRLGRVIYVSTCSNYGLIETDELASEDFELNPLSAYAVAKVNIERKILQLPRDSGFIPTILRFATAFGLSPRMRFDLTVSEFTRELYLGRELLVYDPDTWRPYCHVRDFARAVQMVLEADVDDVAFDVFNAGGDINNFTKRMIVDTITDRLQRGKVCFQEKGSDPRNYRVDFSKIREKIGFVPAVSVEDGVGELIKAMDQGLFRDIQSPPRFFGNYDIDYPLDSNQ